MLRIAGPDEVPQESSVELGRILHPSYGLPRHVVLALVDTPAAGALLVPEEEHPLAPVVPIGAAVPHGERRSRPRRRRH